jgi:hypothetical protein
MLELLHNKMLVAEAVIKENTAGCCNECHVSSCLNHVLKRVYSPHFTRKSLRGMVALVRFGRKVYCWVD